MERSFRFNRFLTLLLTLSATHFSLAQVEIGLSPGLILLDGEYSNFHIPDRQYAPNTTFGIHASYAYRDYGSIHGGYQLSFPELSRLADIPDLSATSSGRVSLIAMYANLNLLWINSSDTRKYQFGPSLGYGQIYSTVVPDLLSSAPPSGIELFNEMRSEGAFLLGGYFKYQLSPRWSMEVLVQNYYIEDLVDGVVGSTEYDDFLMVASIGVSYTLLDRHFRL